MSIVDTSQVSLIDICDVKYAVGDLTILEGITLRCNERRVGIVGRNGSGKSTFGRLLCGLIEPASGTVRIDGSNIAKDRHSAIRTVGMLFQNPDHQIIFPTVEEEVSFGLRQILYDTSESSERALSALAGFGREKWAEKSVATLSQGQRHLVCLISVLVMNPKLIVLDEPYAGLDIPTTMQLTRYIQNISAAVVHISHDPKILADYDRVLWLDEGKIACDGEAAETLQAFSQRMKQIGESDVLF